MKRVIRIARFTAISLAAILLILLTTPLIFQDQIARLVITELNKRSDLSVRAEKISLSLIRDFPRASVEFRDIDLTISHSPCDTTSGELPGLKAKLLLLSFNIRDLAGENLGVDRISVRDGNIIICTDSLETLAGSFRREKERARDISSPLTFDLRNIKIENSSVRIFSGKSALDASVYFNDAEGRLRLAKGATTIRTTSSFNILSFNRDGKTLVPPARELKLAGELIISAGNLEAKDMQLRAGKAEFDLSGVLDKSNTSFELNLATEQTGTELINSLLPEQIASKMSEFIEKGDISADVMMAGNYSDKRSIQIKGELSATGIMVKSRGNFNGLALNSIAARTELFPASAKSSFRSIIHSSSISFAGSDYALSGSISGLESPDIDLTINGECDAGSLLKVYRAGLIESATGLIHVNARLRGQIKDPGKSEINGLLDLKRDINLHFKGVDLSLAEPALKLSEIRGNAMISGSAWIDELSFSYAGQNFIVNSRIDRLNSLIRGGEPSDIIAGIWADRIDFKTISPLIAAVKSRKDKSVTRKPVIVTSTMSIDADSLLVGRFRASQVSGTVAAGTGLVNISSISLSALGGSLSGNAAITRMPSSGYRTSGQFELFNIDINNTFTVFNNFNQQHLVAGNLRGSLSGSLAAEAETDSTFRVLMPSLVAAGNYLIEDGALVGFEPALKLSKFVEVSELADIRFSTLQNRIEIADNRLLIPSMEINSSAFNISVSGEQKFSGEFDYHLKVLLSEILSRKARKSKSYVQEFGPVEDDGLGRTTLYLRLRRGESGTLVNYDVRELSKDIKSDIAQEKQNLRTILNEEYGWYSSDSAAVIPKDNVRRFKIVWEESDSIKSVEPPVEKSRQGGLLKILKNLGTPVKETADTTKKKF